MNGNDRMDCDEFRQAIGACPSDDTSEAVRHERECADCRTLREELATLDETLARAMAIPVPEIEMPELPDREARGRVVASRRRRVPVPAWFGLAAGFALAAYFGLLALSSNEPGGSLAEQVLAHMDHEQGSRIVTTVAVPERTLESVVSNDVARMGPGLGLVTYARSCVINGKVIPHLVVQGENGPITLLLLPDEHVDAPVPLEGDAVTGVILPVGEGSIAIVGERGQDVRSMGNRVVEAVKWKT